MTETNADNLPRRSPLHALHEELGARMVEFAGYSLPLHYAPGIVNEHVHTRTRASLFDVSHMGQVRIAGRDASTELESLMPADLLGLRAGRQRYTFLTNADGGIIDDLMVANLGDSLLLVVNAATKSHDIEHLQVHLAPQYTPHVLADRALLALQGPEAARVIGALAPDTTSMAFMDVGHIRLAGVDCIVSRSGYTGEDGFEISLPSPAAETLARALLDDAAVAPAGLGARDSLRLEAGLCLHGHDIDATTTPVEAGLAWTITEARRPGGARAGGYPGAEILELQLANGVARRRVGLLGQSRVPVRAGAELDDAAGARVGTVTSGGFGPTVGAPVAMGYVSTPQAAPGTELMTAVRGKAVAVRVAALPMVPHRFVRQR